MNSVWHACSRCEKLGPHLLNHKQPENTWLNTYFVVIKSNYCYVVTKTWGANTQVKHVWIPFSRAFVQIPFSRNWGPDPFFKGSGAPWPGDSLFQGFFGLVQHKLAHCICKWPEGWTFMVFAPSLDWVALQPPGAGLFDDIWLVIKDGLCLKPASPVHLPSKPRRVQMHLWLFTFFKVSGGSSSWICFRVESYLAWEPTHEMMWTSASNIRVSRALCSLFQRGIVPVHHHNIFEGFLFLFQGCGGCPRGGGGRGWNILEKRMCPWSFSRNWLGLSPELGQLLGQPVPEGMLFGSFLSTAEPGPALRSGPGAVLAPFGQSLVQVLFCLFQGCLLLLQGFLFLFQLLFSWCLGLFQGLQLLLQAFRRGARRGQLGTAKSTASPAFFPSWLGEVVPEPEALDLLFISEPDCFKSCSSGFFKPVFLAFFLAVLAGFFKPWVFASFKTIVPTTLSGCWVQAFSSLKCKRNNYRGKWPTCVLLW